MANAHAEGAAAAAAARGDANSPFHIHHPSHLTYYKTYAGLLALLVITVLLYRWDANKYTGWVGTNLILAMIVASLKAYLVVRNFMNVKGGTKLIYLWAVIGFIWAILMAGVFMDYQTRSWVDQSGWQPLSYYKTGPQQDVQHNNATTGGPGSAGGSEAGH